MSKQLIETEYQGINLHFTEDAWFNATEAAKSFNKNPYEWLRLPATKKYLEAFERKYGKIPYLKKRSGKKGGTWMHPKLAVRFAQWLNDDFAVWCDEQIDNLIRGTHEHFNWKKAREEVTVSHKLMTDMLKITRDMDGKATKAHHFSNEARLINYALTGKFGKVDRSLLSKPELDLLAQLELRDTTLIARGYEYKERKIALELFVQDWQDKQSIELITAS